MLKDSGDLVELDEDLAQQTFVLRFVRGAEDLTPERMRMVDECIDDLTAARRSLAKLMEKPFYDPCETVKAKQECFSLGKCGGLV